MSNKKIEEKKDRALRRLERMSAKDKEIFHDETVNMFLVIVRLNDIELDQLFIQRLPAVIRQLGNSEKVREECAKQAQWQYQMHTIVEGTFPLEKLPEHVRDIARELYYE